jgi:hypothetical protein
MKLIILVLFIISNGIFCNDILFINKSTFNPNKETNITIPNFNSTWKNQILNINTKNPYERYYTKSTFKISENFNSGIFLLSSKNNRYSQFYFINYDKNQNIISSIDFEIETEIKTKKSNTTYPTLFSINKNNIFTYKKNNITSYQITDNGNIIKEYELEINSVWDMTLIDDYFPNIKHIYLHLPFNLKKQQNIMKNILKNLSGLETFGVFSNEEYNSHLFIKDLTNNCQNLNRFIFGYLTKEKDLNRLKTNCPNLKNLDIILRYSDHDPADNLEIMNSKYRKDFNIIELP